MRRYGVPARWTVIPTGASIAEFDSEHSEPPPELARWCSGKVVFSYVGNLGLAHDFETISSGIRDVAARGLFDGAGVVVAASGPGGVALKEDMISQSPESICFMEPLSDSEWRWLMERSDVALVTLRDSARHASLPSKIFSAMAAQTAILSVAPVDSDLAALIDETGCGVCVAPGDTSTFATAFVHLMNDESYRSGLAERARDAVEQSYDLAKLAVRWEEFLDEVQQGLVAE